MIRHDRALQLQPGDHILPFMDDLLQKLRRRAAALGRTIVLPESSDLRVLEAADRACRDGLCRPLLLGDPVTVRQRAAQASLDLVDDLEILDPAKDPQRQAMVDALEKVADERGFTVEDPQQQALDALFYANLMVRTGRAHGAVMGAVATTAETLRAGLRVLGLDPQHRLVTSCFLMVLADGRPLIYADCGVIPQPKAKQLATIAVLAAQAFRMLIDDEPRVALLSFSTLGSAEHPMLDPVLDACEILRRQEASDGLDFAFDGELQADAALVPEIAERKAVGSPVAGQANVLVFPDLNSGNIAYKLTERLAGARAIGPLLRGLAFPLHDLSRGCSVEDLLDTMAITALERR